MINYLAYMDDKIYKYEDLIRIVKLLSENDLCYDNLTINIGIRTQVKLNQLNNEFLTLVNGESNNNDDDVNEINVRIKNLKFKYYLMENKNDQNN